MAPVDVRMASDRRCALHRGCEEIHPRLPRRKAMFRYKRIIGDALRARKPDAQKREAMIAVNVINRMTCLGIPESVALAR